GGRAGAGLLERQRVRGGAAGGRPRIPADLLARETEELRGVDSHELAAADARRPAHSAGPRERLEGLSGRIAVLREDPDVVEPALLALLAVLPDRPGEQLVEPPGDAAHRLDVVAADGPVH